VRTIQWMALLTLAAVLAGCEAKPAKTVDKTKTPAAAPAEKTAATSVPKETPPAAKTGPAAPADAKTGDMTFPDEPETKTPAAAKEAAPPAKTAAPIPGEKKTGELRFPDDPFETKTPATPPAKEKAKDDPFAQDQASKGGAQGKGLLGAIGNALSKGVAGGAAPKQPARDE